MARSAKDCALVLNSMVGFDPKDSTCVQRPVSAEDFTAKFGKALKGGDASKPLAGLRVGLPKEFYGEGLSGDVRAAIDIALKELQALGAELKDISLPRTQLSIPAYYVIAPAEASSNLSRFDGVRYGHRADKYTDLKSMYENSRSEGFGAEVQRRIMVGSYVLCHGYYDAYYLQAQKIRRLIAQDFQAAFKKCDVIAGPVCPTVAWNLGEKSADPVQMYLADIFTLGASLAGLPGMSVPVGFGNKNRPVGMQLIGNYFQEADLLALADHYQNVTDWHARSPA
jgi:aspartyl-tRNA(Asn)/glutamyl-tRNA(Gln) amidotransferase subunit A